MEKSEKKILIDIGCGLNPKPGYIGLDIKKTSDAKVIGMLPEFPLKLDRIDGFYARHVIEHFNSDNIIAILREAASCLKIGGTFEIVVPHFSNPLAFHFDHKSFWSLNSPHTLCIGGLHDEFIGSHYELETIYLHWMRKEYKGRFPFLVKFMNYIINRNPYFMERFASFYGGIYEMAFILKKVQ